MRALWSHWTAPERARCGSFPWGDPAAGLAARCLSFCTVSGFFPDTVLVTDSPGAELAKRLGMHFGEVRTTLDAIAGLDPRFWSVGKMVAAAELAREGAAFMHVDGDLFFWKRPPDRFISAPVFCEAPYPRSFKYLCLAEFLAAAEASGTGLPAEWDAHLPTGYACPIFGGSDVETLAAFCRVGIELATSARYEPLWRAMGKPHTQLAEEGTFAAVCSGRGVRPAVLFKSGPDKFRPGVAEALGYTHLVGGTKPAFAKRVLRALGKVAPSMLDRCMAVAEEDHEERAAL